MRFYLAVTKILFIFVIAKYPLRYSQQGREEIQAPTY
nr:MAG TPA: hypothetical protein [Caudoviricetes sp.]